MFVKIIKICKKLKHFRYRLNKLNTNLNTKYYILGFSCCDSLLKAQQYSEARDNWGK